MRYEKARERLHERVLRDIRESRPERRVHFLQNSVRFDQNFALSRRKKIISNKLLDSLLEESRKIYKLEQKQVDLEVLCANLLHGQKRKQSLSISLKRGDWCSSRYRRTSYFTLKGVNMLAKKEYVHTKKGYKFARKARQTRIWPTKKLIELFGQVEAEDVRFNPVDTVELRSADGVLLDYKDTRETRRVREILRRVNTVNSRVTIQYILPDGSGSVYSLETNLHAVYNSDFGHSGRLYTATADGYQHLSGEERANILIDNKRTIELDFEGFHPRILYAWEGIQFDDDPYASVMSEDPELRPLLKKVFFGLLNSKDEVTAVRVGNKFLYDNRKFYRLMRKKGLKVKDDIIPAFREAHSPISHYFCKNTGLKVMNLDSKIALDVIKHFADQSIPILAIHDSFIVYKYLREELSRVMQSAYTRHTKGFKCPVK